MVRAEKDQEISAISGPQLETGAVQAPVHTHYRTAAMNDERLIRLPQVEHLTSLKRAHIYALARRGEFPKPLKVGARASAWRESLVREWVSARIREAQDGAAVSPASTGSQPDPCLLTD